MLRKIQTILHPTDFSEQSEAAFDFACSLAREYYSEILLFHVVEPAFIGDVNGLTVPIPTIEKETAENGSRKSSRSIRM